MRVVKSVEEHLVADNWTPGGERVAYRVERFSYPDVVKKLGERTAEDVLKDATAAAAACIRAEIEDVGKGASTVEKVEEISRAFVEVIGSRVAKAVAKSVPAFRDVEREQYLERNAAILKLVAVPKDEEVEPEKSEHRQPGAEDVPHLDAKRHLKPSLYPTPPAVMESGVSRSVAKTLSARGWEPVASADEFEHFVKDEVGEVIVGPEGFAMKSQWDGSVVTGESVPDLEAALDAVE